MFVRLTSVWKPNKFVRISDTFTTEHFLQPNRRPYVRNPNCSDFGRLLYRFKYKLLIVCVMLTAIKKCSKSELSGQDETELSKIQTTVNVRNPNYSKRPKSEQFGFRSITCRSVVKSVRYEKVSEIRTNLFGFQTLVIRTNICSNVRISDRPLS